MYAADGNTALTYGRFGVSGNVYWGGGTYQPWVDYTNAGKANVWFIGGTLTVPNLNGDFIQPVVQNMPANGKPPAAATWDILRAGTVANNNLPLVKKDAKGNQLTLKADVVNGKTVWSLKS